MNKNKVLTEKQFLAALKRRLHALPKEEREAALSYYAEYLEEGNVEELGSVDQVARQILEQCAVNSLETKEKSGGLKTLWIVLLAVFAAPVALPVLLAVAIVVFTMFIVAAVIILTVVISAGAAILGGAVIAALCIVILPYSFVNSLMIAGMGLVAVGIGILLLIGCWYGGKGIVWLLSVLLGGLVKRGAKV